MHRHGPWHSDIGAVISALVRIFRDIGDCRVGITLQMCNGVTNHGDMGAFSKPALGLFHPYFVCKSSCRVISMIKMVILYQNKPILLIFGKKIKNL